MSENKERIELGGEDWWDIKTNVTRGMRKKFRRAALTAVNFHADGQLDIEDPGAIEVYVRTHPEAVDIDAVEDAYLMHGSVEFSFGDEVTLEAIDDIDDAHVSVVLARMNEIYAEVSEEEVVNLDGKP